MEVNFHLPGLRYNYPLNMLLLSLLEQKPHIFREGVKIASFFGEFPFSLWNGGRASHGDQCDAAYVRNVIRAINSKGIPVRFTYTNMLLNEEDCQDPYCNFCMKEADNGMNEVMIVSPVLEKYIRETYPGFKINSSTCKELREIALVNEELKKDYHMVVLDYNFNNRFDELEKIEDKSRCEILVNAVCIPNCPRRGKHYQNIAHNQKIIKKNQKMPMDKQIPLDSWYCEHSTNNSIYKIQDYCTYVSPEAIWGKYVPMGFSHFKIEGRTDNIFGLVETYCHYLIKEEYQGDARIQLLSNLRANNIIIVNKPKSSKWP
jgi:collagenase-like PrtC family protease